MKMCKMVFAVGLLVLLYSGTAQAQAVACLTSDAFINRYNLAITGSSGDFFDLTLRDRDSVRAAYGAGVPTGANSATFSWSKSSPVGVVAYFCDLTLSTLVGPGAVTQVFAGGTTVTSTTCRPCSLQVNSAARSDEEP